jgi:hypothetical protein
MFLQVRKCCAKGCHMRWLRARRADTEDCKALSWNSALFLEKMRSGMLTWSRNWRRRDVAVRLDLVFWTLGRVLPSALQYWLSLLLCSWPASFCHPMDFIVTHSSTHVPMSTTSILFSPITSADSAVSALRQPSCVVLQIRNSRVATINEDHWRPFEEDRLDVEAAAAVVLSGISTIHESDACAVTERVYKRGFAHIRIERFHDVGSSAGIHNSGRYCRCSQCTT